MKSQGNGSAIRASAHLTNDETCSRRAPVPSRRVLGFLGMCVCVVCGMSVSGCALPGRCGDSAIQWGRVLRLPPAWTLTFPCTTRHLLLQCFCLLGCGRPSLLGLAAGFVSPTRDPTGGRWNGSQCRIPDLGGGVGISAQFLQIEESMSDTFIMSAPRSLTPWDDGWDRRHTFCCCCRSHDVGSRKDFVGHSRLGF